MVAGGYIAIHVVYGLIEITLMVLSAIQFYSGRWIHYKATGRLLRFMHLLVVAAVVLNFVRCIDPDCVLRLYPPAVNQWTSCNVTAILICGATFFLLNLMESIANFYGGLDDKYLLGVYGIVTIELIGAELSVALAMFYNRWWPTTIFLFINAPLLLVLLGGLTYAAHTTRKAVNDSMSAVEGLKDAEEDADRARSGSDSAGLISGKHNRSESLDAARERNRSAGMKFKTALSKLLWVQIGASVMITATVVFCFVVGSSRIHNTALTLDDALHKDPDHYTVASVDWTMWLQIVTLGGAIAYAWVPMPWEAKAKTPAEIAEEEAAAQYSDDDIHASR